MDEKNWKLITQSTYIKGEWAIQSTEKGADLYCSGRFVGNYRSVSECKRHFNNQYRNFSNYFGETK